MAATTAASTTEVRESREQEKGSKSQIVIVDLDEPQPSRSVNRLRKGKGKLLTKVDRIINDLVEAGTIKSTVQPVVLVVREIPSSPWFFEEEDDD